MKITKKDEFRIVDDLLYKCHVDILDISSLSRIDPIRIIKLAILKKRNQNLKIIFNDNVLGYLDRINFFNYVGDTEIKNKFTGSRPDIVEVCTPNIANSNIFESLKDAIVECGNDEQIEVADDLVSEIFSNVETHSQASNSAFMAQRIGEKLVIAIGDDGIGIADGLRLSDKYSKMSNNDLVVKAFDFKVTNGKGRGYGLTITKNTVKTGSGKITAYSSGIKFDPISRKIIRNGNKNYGTFIRIEYNIKKAEKFNAEKYE